MDWNTVVGLIKPELFVLIVFLWCIGLFLKKSPWFTAEWVIPFILLVVSVIMTIAYLAVIVGEGFTAKVTLTGLIQGVLIASVSVFGNELLKQLFVKRLQDKEE
jgi:ABC-type Na+ efflux pump permease subunit